MPSYPPKRGTLNSIEWSENKQKILFRKIYNSELLYYFLTNFLVIFSSESLYSASDMRQLCDRKMGWQGMIYLLIDYFSARLRSRPTAVSRLTDGSMML